MRNKLIVFFIAVLVIAGFLRIFNLHNVSMYGDELTIVYDSFSILKTGRDQLGNFLPITFPMGAGRPGGYVYGSVPFVGIFGPTVFGVRGLSILSGLLLIVISYFLLRKLTDQKKLRLIVPVLLIFSPWALNLSRGGFESHFGLLLSVTGLTALLYAKQKPWLFLISGLMIGLAIHTYPTFKLTLPFMLLLFGWYSGLKSWMWLKGVKKYFIGGFLILCFFALISVWQTFFGVSESRFLSINIFSDETITRSITENVVIERNLSEEPTAIDPLFHNRYIKYPVLFMKNYFDSLSIRYLFLEGDYNPRHNMTQSGAFLVVEIITVLIGMIYLMMKNKRLLLLLLGWIIIAPIATALLVEVHTLRNSLLFLPITILSAFGIYYLIENVRKLKVIYILFIALIIFGFMQLSFIFERLYFVSPNLFSRHWAYPAMQLSEHIKREKNDYDYIIVRDNIDNIEYAYPTYAMLDPREVVDADRHKYSLNNRQFKKFGNVYIGGIADSEAEEFLSQLPGRVLYFANSEQMKTLNNYVIVTGKDNLVSYIVKEVSH